MSEVVNLNTDGNVAVVTVNSPPVNALSHAVREGIHNAMSSAFADSSIHAIVLHCEGRTFMAGADIREFGKPPKAPSLRDVIETMEAGPKPIVAALHGTALGGGFETALCCHYRVANPQAKVGLPEVKLGILPGAGGTQRTPRLIGVAPALDLMISGEPVGAAKALELGLIDEICEGDLLEAAVDAARRIAAMGEAPRRVSELSLENPGAAFFSDYRKGMGRKTRGLFSPERIVQCVEHAVNLPVAEGLKAERTLFEQCMDSTQSAGLRHIFFAERQVTRVPGIDRDTPRRTIEQVGIVGAGTMGGGIAMVFANAGIAVTVVETSRESLDRGLDVMQSNYITSVSRGRMSQAVADERMGRITGSVDLADLADADLVIEAVFENMDVKHEVFRQLDLHCKPDAILATNTSTLNVDQIAQATSRPQDVLGLHFFSPANVMRLLEIVRGEKTGSDVLASCIDLARRVGKTGVVSGVCYGFIGNRMLEGYLREMNFMLLEGTPPERIDKVVYDYGMAMGPCAMSDLAGLDVGYRIREGLRTQGDLPDDPGYCRATDALVEAGRNGQKNHMGIYRYESGSRAAVPDADALEIIAAQATQLGITSRVSSDQEIFERLMYPLINEGARILEEGIALRAGDIDTVWICGYGFPRHWGGPMFAADQIGVGVIRERMQYFAKEFGNPHGYWDTAPLLDKLASSGSAFSSWEKEGTKT